MPSNRPQLQLSSASQQQFRRPRRSVGYGRRSSYGQPGAKDAALDGASIVTAAGGSAVDLENVNPQQQRQQTSVPAKSPAMSSVDLPSPAQFQRMHASQIMTFEDFQRLRREAPSQRTGRLPVLPMGRSKGRRHVQEVDGESVMSFDEFRQMKRLLDAPKDAKKEGKGEKAKKKGQEGKKKEYGATIQQPREAKGEDKKAAGSISGQNACVTKQSDGPSPALEVTSEEHLQRAFDAFRDDDASHRALDLMDRASNPLEAAFRAFGNDEAAARASETLSAAVEQMEMEPAAPMPAPAAIVDEAEKLLTITATQSVVAHEPAEIPLPDGVPAVLLIPEDWEERAGFVPSGEQDDGAKNEKTKESRARESIPRAAVEEDEEIDPRNASTWVVCDEEDLDDDDDEDDVNVGPLLEEEEADAVPDEEFDAESPKVTFAETPTSEVEGEYGFGRLSLEERTNFGATPTNEVDDRLGEFSPVKFVKRDGGDGGAWASIDNLNSQFEGAHFDEVSRGVRGYGIEPRTRFEKDQRNASAKLLLQQAKARLAVDTTLETVPTHKSGPKRELKGRVLLIRIRRKISRVGKLKGILKRMIFGSKSKNGVADGCEIVTDVKVFVPSPRSNNEEGPPVSPSSISVLSIASSVVDHNGATIIGATPVKSGMIPPELLYGAIDYAESRSMTSTLEGADELPPPPGSAILPPMISSPRSSEEEDAVSYLAEAMRNFGSEEDGEGVLLLMTPREDGTTEGNGNAEAGGDGVDAVNQANDNQQNFTHFFSGEDEEIVEDDMPMQIVDAFEVEGGFLLTPSGQSRGGTSEVFRFSGEEAAQTNLLPNTGASDTGVDDDSALMYDTTVQKRDESGDETINIVADAAQQIDISALVQAISPSNDSVTFIGDIVADISPKGRKKSPKTKTIPKSASKTHSKRTLVKGRVSDLQQRIDIVSTASSFDGSTYSSRSSRSGASRTSLGYIRSVPIGIARSRESLGSGSIGPRDEACYAQKYTNSHHVRSVPIGITRSYTRDSLDGSIGYARSFDSCSK